MPNSKLPVILASSSIYRKQLLARLLVDFKVQAANIDETPMVSEPIADYVLRLAEEKAAKVAASQPQSLIIGSDQALVFDGKIIGKASTKEIAKERLANFSGKEVKFYTGVCLINAKLNQNIADLDITTVSFKKLTPEQIDYYVENENVLNCAGSFQVEALGIALCDKIESTDPTALIGLPLIKLCKMFSQLGVDILSY